MGEIVNLRTAHAPRFLRRRWIGMIAAPMVLAGCASDTDTAAEERLMPLTGRDLVQTFHNVQATTLYDENCGDVVFISYADTYRKGGEFSRSRHRGGTVRGVYEITGEAVCTTLTLRDANQQCYRYARRTDGAVFRVAGGRSPQTIQPSCPLPVLLQPLDENG